MNFPDFKKKYEKVPVEHYPNEVVDNPIVSVCVQTYNHAPYIKECVEGILMQQTEFPIEILLGEDASTDGTREVCIEYAQKHPDKIRLFLHHRENNIRIGGQSTGRFNFLFNLYSARGIYIALCEGDDYWTDPKKLQKQIEFLDQNKEYVMCFHDCEILLDGKLTSDYITKTNNKNIFVTEDLASERNFIHTPTVVFRNYQNCIPYEVFKSSSVGDYILYLFLSLCGNIYRIPLTMAVYRVHEGGVWSTLDKFSKREKRSRHLKAIVDHFPHPSMHAIRKRYIKSCIRILRYDFNKLELRKIPALLFTIISETFVYFFESFNLPFQEVKRVNKRT